MPPHVERQANEPTSNDTSGKKEESCDSRDHVDPIACAFHLYSDFETPEPLHLLHANHPVQSEQVHQPHLTEAKKEWNCYNEFTP